eukprot:CAMPEP_0178433246 /NCGR_PEP_ID=MMETSP0689_2-20121128/32806_1 /TAXON_ID=160604 /ORGANISM="Amphidinium massartii, Strain CS-259" /LENGTH=262 /DNA_ID=CAMNT_0020055267 /DNA_START=95 /DNA_END=883 /DNA_ORIENTATION=+
MAMAQSRSPLKHYAVQRQWGSLPMGGSVESAPIHALAPESVPKVPRESAIAPTRTDLPLHEQLAFVIDNVLTPEECDEIIRAGETMGFIDAAPGIRTPPGMRMNKACHWIADESLQGGILARIRHLLPERLDGDLLHDKLSHRVALYKYNAGDVFRKHIDGQFPGYSLSEDRQEIITWEDNLRSKLSLLIYLNGAEDGVSGGATELYSKDGSSHAVTPKQGSALLFQHGHDMETSVFHMGKEVHGSVPKYVARINVMYNAAA